MALRLLDADALFIHVPKCGGHWVEEVLKACGIAYKTEQPITNTCPRHGNASDYAPAKFTFCTLRNVRSWMRSYWCYHMTNGHRGDIWQSGVQYHHRHLGPPMPSWQEFETRWEECQDYLDAMAVGCLQVIWMRNLLSDLPELLRSLGYSVTDQQVASVPRANVTKLKIELGGGIHPRGDSFTNVDILPVADLQWDLSHYPYPFPDASVDEVYSSHCLEHIPDPHRVLSEIARICKVGATVTIRVPHPNNPMAMCDGHLHVLSPLQVINTDVHFRKTFWTEERALKLESTTLAPTLHLEEAKRDLPFLRGLSDEVIMKWIPGTCHDSTFVFKCVANR